MRKLLKYIPLCVLALGLANCAQLQAGLSQAAIDLNVASGALPPSCSALGAGLTTVAALPSLSATASAKLTANTAVFNKYCTQAQTAVTAAENIVEIALTAVQSIQAANGQL